MSEAGPQNIATPLMDGIAQVFGAFFDGPAKAQTETPESLTAEGLGALFERCPAVLFASMSIGGSIALAFPETLAAHIATLAGAGGPEDDTTVDDARLETLREIASTILNGATGHHATTSGDRIELEDSSAALLSPGDAETFAANFGAMDAAMFTLTFDSGPAGEGMFIYSTTLADFVAGAAAGEEPLVSDDEMKDILSGFGDDSAGDTAQDGAQGKSTENLDVILGIELTATARLGRVEMSIAEVLNLGPGSIVEVGQFVDEPVELLVNDKLVAKGDVVVVDEKFGLRITEIVSQKERIRTLR